MNRPLFLLVLSCLVLSNLLIPSCIGLEDVSRQLRYCIIRKCSCARALQAHDSFMAGIFSVIFWLMTFYELSGDAVYLYQAYLACMTPEGPMTLTECKLKRLRTCTSIGSIWPHIYRLAAKLCMHAILPGALFTTA